MKVKTRFPYRKILATLFILLGMKAYANKIYDPQQVIVAYGSPSAEFVIRGKVISAEGNQKGVKGVRIVFTDENVVKDAIREKGKSDVKILSWGFTVTGQENVFSDTVYTDKNGEFLIKTKITGPITKYRVKAQDIDQKKNGLFVDWETILEFDREEFKNGDDRFRVGTVERDMGVIQMLPNQETEK